MIQILHMTSCSDAGGISSVILNYYSHMDRNRFHFDIALLTETVGQNAKALQNLGAELYYIPPKHLGIKAHTEALTALLKEHHYDAIHIHVADTAYVSLRVAKQCGVKIRIAHSHGAAKNKTLNQLLRLAASAVLNPIYATDLLACGRLAGKRCYGKLNIKRKNFHVLPNAIDTERFAFNPSVREEMRRKLGVEDAFVLGMVGRLSYEKNYYYALKIMEKLHEKHPNAVLLILGVGEEQQKMETYIAEHKMDDYVKLLGRHVDVEKYYQAFDLFLLSSFNEGFPVAAVEAMASGLPVLLSDAITDELNFGDDVYYLPLNDVEPWVETICKLYLKADPALRENRQRRVRENGFEIRDAAKKLEAIYMRN